MHDALLNIITQFNHAQAYVMTVMMEYGIRKPESNSDWTGIKIPDDVLARINSNGIKIYKHGYGLSYRDDKLFIDFDFGETGQTNGFDAHRLLNFANQNNISIPFKSLDEIRHEIEKAIQAQEIVKSRYINYYLSQK
jgi:hypothetical protein